MVSQVWSENLSSVFTKHFCHYPSSRAVSHFPVIRNHCVISAAVLLYGYIIMGGHISLEAGRVNVAFTETF